MICTCGKSTTHGVYEGGTSKKYCKVACLVSDWNKHNSWKINEQEVHVMEWGFKVEKNVEVGGFAPISGTYVARIDNLSRKKGVGATSGKDYDFYSLNMQVVKTVKGDKGEKRFLSQSYNPDDAGIKKLANDMFTAGIDVDTSSEKLFEASFEKCIDKLITVRAWAKNKPIKNADGEWIEFKDSDGKPVKKQYMAIPSIQEDTKAIEDAEIADIPF